MPRRRGMTKAKADYKQSKEKASAWFITMNPHESADGLSPEDLEATKEDYKEVIREVFEKNWVDLIYFVDGEPEFEKILSVDNYITVEVQTFNNAHQIHTHNSFVVKHTSKIQLDYADTKELLKAMVLENCPGANNPNIEIHMSSSKGANEKEYMEKKTGHIWSKEKVSESYREKGPEKTNRKIMVVNADC